MGRKVNRKAIIHIGSGKTGSTSIQASLSKIENSKSLYFPKILSYENNQVFRFAFCQLEKTPRNIRLKYENNAQGFAQFQKAIKESFSKACEEIKNDVIISSEFLFLSGRSEVSSIKQFLESLGFNEFHIIAYVRSPDSYYLSVAQQALKTGPQLPQPLNFDYAIKNSLETWLTFQPASFNVREFDRPKLVEGNVVKDFEYLLNGIGISCKLPNAENQNQTMSAEATQIIQDAQRVLDNIPFDNEKRVDYLTLPEFR